MTFLPVIIQFFRNFFCIVKALVPSDSTWHQKPLINYDNIHLYNSVIQNTLKNTTYLEYIIAPLQFLAVIFNFSNSINDITYFINNYGKYEVYLSILDRYSYTKQSSYITILRQQLLNEKKKVNTSLLTCILSIIIGIGFFILTCNSLHIEFPGHPKPVYDALIGQELCLLYYLYIMIIQIIQKFNNHQISERIISILNTLDSSDNISNANTDTNHTREVRFMTLLHDLTYDNNTNIYVGLFIIDNTYSTWHNNTTLTPTTRIERELDNIQQYIHNITNNPDKSKQIRLKYKQILTNNSQNKHNNIIYSILLDILYFILNVIAGYSYMIAILSWYTTPYVSSENVTSSSTVVVPYWLNTVCLGLSPSQADW